MIQFIAVYVLWLREMKKFLRVKSRVLGTMAMPFFMLVFMGLGFRRVEIPGIIGNIEYIQYLVPGMIGMTVLFSSSFSGVSILMDKQFGFLKEIMVSPVSRFSIVVGRIFGGGSISIIQGVIILVFSLMLGFKIQSITGFLGAILYMSLISVSFISIGMIFVMMMKDVHGFNMIMNVIVFPIFLLSGALFPVSNLPAAIQVFSYLSPLTYGVDGMRGLLCGYQVFPHYLNISILLIVSLVAMAIAAHVFKSAPAQ